MRKENSFIAELSHHNCLTENGALSNSSTKNVFVDQFSSVTSYMHRSVEEVFSDQNRLWEVDKLNALKFIYYIRTISRDTKHNNKNHYKTNGQGLRDESFKRLLWVAINDEEVFYRNIELLPIIGSWKDIWELMWYDINLSINVLNRDKMFRLLASGLTCEETCDLVKKYMPTIYSFKRQKTKRANIMSMLACQFANYMGWTNKQYRQCKRSGVAHTFQQQISTKMFDDLNWSYIPGKALTKLVASNFILNHNLLDSYEKWVDNQEDVKFTGFVYELGHIFNTKKLQKHQQYTLNKQFDHLVRYTKSNSSFKENIWCALDTSGSMACKYNNREITPYDVCTSLGVFFSTLNDGAFHKQVIMFDDVSVAKQLSGTFTDMMSEFKMNGAMGGTNFTSVVQRIVQIRKDNPEIPLCDYPTTLLVVSDMQFNSVGNHQTNYEYCKELLMEVFPSDFVESFKFVWWNVATKTRDFPSQINDGGTFMLSGFDGSIISLLLGEEITEHEQRKPKTMVELVENALSQDIFNFLVI